MLAHGDADAMLKADSATRSASRTISSWRFSAVRDNRRQQRSREACAYAVAFASARSQMPAQQMPSPQPPSRQPPLSRHITLRVALARRRRDIAASSCVLLLFFRMPEKKFSIFIDYGANYT